MANIRKRRSKNAPGRKKASQPSLQAVIGAAKAIGLTQIKYNGITIAWGEQEAKSNIKDLKANIKQTASSDKAEDLISPESIFDQYTDDEILFWSTEYYDQLEAKKKADKEKQDGNI